MVDSEFRERYWGSEKPRQRDCRDEYQRDRARIIHSAAFRRLQAKTQVMGVGEGDFHRTRLTHSIEAGQIGEGLLTYLREAHRKNPRILRWLPTPELIVAACYAHDLGHPPFGHGGEKALNGRMAAKGGFEGNGQTLRIVTRLEKYRPQQGINPTRRLVLAILKYPIAYSKVRVEPCASSPPKCYFDTERPIVEWALKPFTMTERRLFTTPDKQGKAAHRTLDASIMEHADDIAYAVHDLEDIVARRLVTRLDVLARIEQALAEGGNRVGPRGTAVDFDDFRKGLLGEDSTERKALIGRLVNLFVTSAEVYEENGFSHELLRFRLRLPKEIDALLAALKSMTRELVIQRAEVQQLERRGQRIVEGLFDEFVQDPEHLIPAAAWRSLGKTDSLERRVCDYVAGMTDTYAEKIYQRLFMPGFGSSRDEL